MRSIMRGQEASEIEETLNSLDDWSRLQTSPYFYAKLRAKMEQPESMPLLKWGLAGLCLTMAFNIFTYFNLAIIEEKYSDSVAQLASEYNMEWTSDYFNELAE